jgi:hypothetical protein
LVGECDQERAAERIAVASIAGKLFTVLGNQVWITTRKELGKG